MPQDLETLAKPRRTRLSMALWTAGLLLALGCVWLVAVVVPLARARSRVRTLLNSPYPKEKGYSTIERGLFFPTVEKDSFFPALAGLAEAQNKNPGNYVEFHNGGASSRLVLGRAVTVRSGRRTYVMAILGCFIASVPGISVQQLVLMDPDGRILDKLSCDMNSRYGVLVTEVRDPPDSDGAQAVLVCWCREGHWHNWHTICHGTMAVTFREQETETPSAWDRKGLCRVGIDGDRFEILWPEMNSGEAKETAPDGYK